MCGLAGIVTFDGSDPDAGGGLARTFSDRLAHRGPDGQGVWTGGVGGARVLLVHRRLVVLDPLPRSDQPFVTDHGRRAVVFNGEIYNFRTLRGRLPGPDGGWATDGDTEVLARAYATRGTDAPHDFDGMFAFAGVDLTDPQRPRVDLVRDPAGEKPLFYAVQSGARGGVAAVAFASELHALLAVPWVDFATDSRQIAQYLSAGYVDVGRTVYCGVREVLPGGGVTVTPAGVVSFAWFSPAADPIVDWRHAVSETRLRVQASTASRLVSDVPLGCLLSGGIDSSVIAACAAAVLRGHGRRLRTFSVGFDDPRYDESAAARQVARHVDADHVELRLHPDPAGIEAQLQTLVRAVGQPFADSSALPTSLLARETRRHVTVALGGDGGDEVFGGYDRYRALRLARAAGRLPRFLQTALAAAGGAYRGGHPRSLPTRVARLLRSIDDTPAGRYRRMTRLFTDDEVRLLTGMPPTHDDGDWHEWPDPASAAAATDRRAYLPGDLLVKLDRCSMRFALEVRAPMLSPDLLRLADAVSRGGLLPRSLGGPFARSGKRLLAEAFAADLPRSVFTRRKSGFAVPIGQWFRGPLRDPMREALLRPGTWDTAGLRVVRTLLDEHARGLDHAQRLYALWVLQIWRQSKSDWRG